MPRWSQSLWIVALGLACVLPAHAQWKWRDKDGRTQYSDVPPPSSVKDSDILQRPNSARGLQQQAAPADAAASVASSAGAAAAKVDPELEARRKKAEELEAAKQKEAEQKSAAAKKDNCARARGYMKSLEDGIRISRTNNNGEREILDDEARTAEVKRAQSVIKSDCAK